MNDMNDNAAAAAASGVAMAKTPIV